MADQLEVYRELKIDARPEVVFAFFTDATKLLEWIGIEATLEPLPGGLFRVSPNGKDVIRGEFVEVIPNRRVVFTWGYEEPGDRPAAGSSTVEVTLEPRDGGTLLRLRHTGLAKAAREKHELGWTHYLGRLAIRASGNNPGPDLLARPDAAHG
jgi:uncharacterized protein YndB with AHSA1/START domain